MVTPIERTSLEKINYRGAGILFYDNEGVYLIFEKNRWGEPGGKIEICDKHNPFSTANRELKEETAVEGDFNIDNILHLDFEKQYSRSKDIYNYILFVVRKPAWLVKDVHFTDIDNLNLRGVPNLYRVPIVDLKNIHLTNRFKYFMNFLYPRQRKISYPIIPSVIMRHIAVSLS